MKKIISLVLLVCILSSLLPTFSAHAVENDSIPTENGTRYEVTCRIKGNV